MFILLIMNMLVKIKTLKAKTKKKNRRLAPR